MKYIIKSTLLTFCLFVLLPNLEIMAQQIDPDPESFEFKKTVEPAMIAHGLHNTKGKNASHQKFFSGYNSKVEFFMNHSFKGSSGFRIDSLDECNYRLEVKWISNRQEVLEKLRKEFPLKSIKAGESFTLTEEEKKEIAKYNRRQTEEMYSKASEKYEIETKEISVSKSLGDKLYEITTLLIDSHVNKEIPRISKDGYTAIFRCVVGEEVWDFSAKNPSGIFKEMTNICTRIVESVKENGDGINENEYISLLDTLVEKK